MLVTDLLVFVGSGVFFLALERVRPLHGSQPILRAEVLTDLAHFVVNKCLVVAGLIVILMPAMLLADALVPTTLRAAVARQPAWLQFIELTLMADLGIYVGHRLTHIVPWLWRFHAIHHSARDVDWLTATRNHPVDLIFVRIWMLLPAYILGFSGPVWAAYLLYFALQSFFLHANVRLPLGRLGLLYAGPDYHRWHHSDAAAARDKNFVTHFPWLDLLFGTLYMPSDARPEHYGLHEPTPAGYVAQLVRPFRSPRARETALLRAS
jgi:sterol desaturase/sphingolipid hydroxylase (fatty acid hydroxylase superfamily)